MLYCKYVICENAEREQCDTAKLEKRKNAKMQVKTLEIGRGKWKNQTGIEYRVC